MAKMRRQAYSVTFRQEMVEMVRAGRHPSELAKQFGPSVETIRNWVRQAGRDERRQTDPAIAELHGQLIRLQFENQRLREERDILAKAMTLFARKMGTEADGQA